MEPDRVEWFLYVDGKHKCTCRDEEEVKIVRWVRARLGVTVEKRETYPDGRYVITEVREKP